MGPFKIQPHSRLQEWVGGTRKVFAVERSARPENGTDQHEAHGKQIHVLDGTWRGKDGNADEADGKPDDG